MSTQERIWTALGEVGTRHDEAAIIAASGFHRATVRRYLKLWELAGHVKVRPEPRSVTDTKRDRRLRRARTVEKLRDGPHFPRIYFDCGGTLAYVNHPVDDCVATTIHSYRGRHEVSHRRRTAGEAA